MRSGRCRALIQDIRNKLCWVASENIEIKQKISNRKSDKTTTSAQVTFCCFWYSLKTRYGGHEVHDMRIGF